MFAMFWRELERIWITGLHEQAVPVVVDAGLDDVIFRKEAGRQRTGLIAPNEDLHGMILDLAANTLNIALGRNIAATHQNQLVGNDIDFLQHMTREDHVAALDRKRAEESDRFGADQRIQPVERFIEYQDARLVRKCLGEANPLAHALL